MSKSERTDGWASHLSSSETPSFHFVSQTATDNADLELAARRDSFSYSLLDVSPVSSSCDLFTLFAKAMKFPDYFGNNWNALYDCLTDVSWSTSSGNVLAIKNSDSLFALKMEEFQILVGVLEESAALWRGKDESNCFAIVFSGSEKFLRELKSVCKGPVCEHDVEEPPRIEHKPGGVTRFAEYEDALKLLRAGAEIELILSFLRERKIGERDSSYILASITRSSVAAADSMVRSSSTWSDRYERDSVFREAARRALRDLGFMD